MDADELNLELNDTSKFLKLLSRHLDDIRVDIQFCPCKDEIYNELLKIEELTTQIYEITSVMKSLKHMAEI